MGSPFASLTKSDPVPLPFDQPNCIVVRKLTAREVEKAQASHRADFVIGRTRSWSEQFRRAMKEGAPDPLVLKAIADPLTGYDRYVVARAGLVSWTYPQSLTATPARPAVEAAGDVKAQPAVEAYDPIEDLDDEAVDFIATEVMRQTKPWLFQTAEQQENERKNDYGGSIVR